MSENKRGKFITLEGIEGVGKSSNVRFIAEQIQNAGHQVVITREPGGTQVAEGIRKILLSEFSEPTLPETELLLLYAGRLQHVEHVIKPALHAQKWVVCDRFTDATYAYQGGGRGIDNEKIDNLNRWTLGEFAPDCTIILDAPVEIALQRIKNHRVLDRFEKEEVNFFEKIRAYYLSRAMTDHKRYHVIDASQSLLEVQSALKAILQKTFGI